MLRILVCSSFRRSRPRGLRRLGVRRRPPPKARAGGNVRLVVYSTPREAYAKLTDLYTVRCGQGRRVRPVVRQLRRAEPRGRGGAPGRRRRVLARARHDSPGRRRHRSGRLELPASTRAWSPTPWSCSWCATGIRRGSRRWDDLTKAGVEVITPNPFTSGGARWNVMAGYGAQLELGKSEEQARDYLRKLFANVTVQDKSARESLTTFAAGKGDVLLAYENEAIFAQREGQPFDYIVPDQTILIENPVAAPEDASRPARTSSTSCSRTRRRRSSATRATGPSRKPFSTRSTSRRPRRSSRSPISAAGSPSRRSSSTARRGFMAEVQRELGQPTD